MENNFPKTRERELRDLVGEYSDIFRTKRGSGPPATIPPMIVKLKPDAVPVRVRCVVTHHLRPNSFPRRSMNSCT